MKRYTLLFTICFIAIYFVSCRPMGDDLLSYGQNDYQAFYDSERSFAGEFKALWTAMNENYCIWDYEAEYGIDWDDIYNTYLPLFEALDDTTRKEKVTDQELRDLYSQFIDSLHDGHMALQIKNLHTGKYIMLQPGVTRNIRERGQQYLAEGKYITNLNAYQTPVTNPNYNILQHSEINSSKVSAQIISTVCSNAIKAANEYIALVDNAGGPNPTNDSLYKSVKDLTQYCIQLLTANNPEAANFNFTIQAYNNLCNEYKKIGEMIGVKLTPIEDAVAYDGLKKLEYSLFANGIVYLRLGSFSLTTYLEPTLQTTDSSTMLFAYQSAVQKVWQEWFDAIQTLHIANNLGGVIIDVRNNGGGYVNDYKYVLGALLPSGNWNSHTLRIKNGIGRLDYAPLLPFTMGTMEEQHEVIDDVPIVVLANSRSVSMAENTTYGVLSQANGCFIGTRTYGALSALNTDPADYSSTYSGAFGVQNQTPIWGYIPKYVCLYGEEQRPVEGYGFAPDIEVQLDTTLWLTTGRDNQLEAAIKYINNAAP